MRDFANILIWLCVVLVQSVIFGAITEHVSRAKGYDSGFAWGFWLWLIGVIVVACKPTVINTTPYHSSGSAGNISYKGVAPLHLANHRELESLGWVCSCGSRNPSSVDMCLSCRRNRGDIEKEEKVSCPRCGAKNNRNNTLCFACSTPLNQQTAPQPTAAPARSTSTAALSETDRAVEQLRKLDDLYRDGVLSEAEFHQKMEEVVKRL